VTRDEAATFGAFLQAVAGHLTAPGPGPEQDVRLACAAVTGHGLNLDVVGEFTSHLNAEPPPPPRVPQCQCCGAATGLDPVHVPPRVGVATRVEFYCHDRDSCYARRHHPAVSA
jgi:hypothetical protein